jgi:hypothetical protein
MAKNNIYPAKSEEIFKRYAKVPVNIVAGLRVDPFDTRIQVGWTLSTSEEDFDFSSKTRRNFVYDNEVIELYSSHEDVMFRRLNKNLLDKGLLKEYTGIQAENSSNNFISDEQVAIIVEIKSLTDFKQELEKFTSVATLSRIKEMAIATNKSVKKVQIIEARLKAVQDELD